MNADITLINLNMLFMRYGEEVERELHVPLGPLYLTRALDDAGFKVDFRDYQCVDSDDPFEMDVLVDFLSDPAPIIGLSCMANLLPFTILAIRRLREEFPDRQIVLGGVGSKSVEEKLLSRFPWIEIIARGESELTGPDLVDAIKNGKPLENVRGISFRTADGQIIHTPDRERITQLDDIPLPAFDRVELSRYAGYGMMTSRGCPYPCTFCSVAPVWNHESFSRSPKNIVDEMEFLHREAGVEMFLFQDEFFVSGKNQVMKFCDELRSRKLDVFWKAFGRVNLVDREMMETMERHGCVELRFGIESGCDRVLERIKKSFTAAETLEVIPPAIEIFPRVDTFFVWGFPFETMEDFQQTLFQMFSFRMLGARILPSLLSLLPQTEVYREWEADPDRKPLEFCPYLLPEFVVTGHEVVRGSDFELPEKHQAYFDFIQEHPDIFSGFFLVDIEGNVMPKLAQLRQFGFYPESEADKDPESCGAHSPRHADAPKEIRPEGLITRAD